MKIKNIVKGLSTALRDLKKEGVITSNVDHALVNFDVSDGRDSKISFQVVILLPNEQSHPSHTKSKLQ